MTVLSFVFEGALALLMVVLIVYCVKLNRGLVAIRSSDTQINELIARLIESSDRAEASAAQLKAVGVAQERLLREAIRDADAARARLGQPGQDAPRAATAPATDQRPGPAEISLPSGAADSLESLVGLGANSPSGAPPALSADPRDDGREEEGGARSEVEQTLLAAIRHARAAG